MALPCSSGFRSWSKTMALRQIVAGPCRRAGPGLHFPGGATGASRTTSRGE